MRWNSQSDKRFTFKLNPETPAITHKSLVSFKCRGKKNKKTANRRFFNKDIGWSEFYNCKCTNGCRLIKQYFKDERERAWDKKKSIFIKFKQNLTSHRADFIFKHKYVWINGSEIAHRVVFLFVMILWTVQVYTFMLVQSLCT